jgi:hypothetical protein
MMALMDALHSPNAQLEIDIACRTLLAVDPSAARSITVVLPGESSTSTPMLATRIAHTYGLDAVVTSSRGSLKVRIVRRLPASSASPARR